MTTKMLRKLKSLRLRRRRNYSKRVKQQSSKSNNRKKQKRRLKKLRMRKLMRWPNKNSKIYKRKPRKGLKENRLKMKLKILEKGQYWML
jgi:hypothetical protein